MARFAGSGYSVSPINFSTAGGGAGAAAGIVDFGAMYGSQRATSPKFDQLAAAAQENETDITTAGMAAEAAATNAGITSTAQTQGYKMQAEASIEAAKAEAEATKSYGMMSGFGQIASAGLGLLTKSDETIKTDIKRIDTALEKLRNLKPVTFYYKEEYSDSPERMHHGFIAQEFQKVLPDATYYDESIGKLAIDTGDVIGLLVRANQELEARIGMLEAKQALATV